MKKSVLAMTALSVLMFGQTVLTDSQLQTFKQLKPLDNKGVKITDGIETDSLYILKLRVTDTRGTKIVPASVTKDKRFVVIGTAYDTQSGEALGTTDMKRFLKDTAFSMGTGDKYGGEFFVFTDPDCPICKQLEAQIRKEGLMKYAKIHVFFYPLDRLHPDARKKCEYILSLPREKRPEAYEKLSSGDDSWKKYEADADIKAKMAVMTGIGEDLNIAGTPSFFDAQGNEISGRVMLAYLRAIKKKVQQETSGSGDGERMKKGDK